MSAQDPAEIDQTTDFMWKATAAVATLASGFVAEKVVALGWRAISGKPAPREEDQLLNYKLAEIVTFAINSGATVTLEDERFTHLYLTVDDPAGLAAQINAAIRPAQA